MSFVYFLCLFIYYHYAKNVVYWETMARFGMWLETPEYFIKEPLRIIVSVYILWIIVLIVGLFTNHPLRFSIFLIILSFIVSIEGRLSAYKERDKIRKELCEYE